MGYGRLCVCDHIGLEGGALFKDPWAPTPDKVIAANTDLDLEIEAGDLRSNFIYVYKYTHVCVSVYIYIYLKSDLL